MSINSLIEQGINNPPVDMEQPRVEGGRVTSPLAQARYEAFVKMADTSSPEDGASPGARFGIDMINASQSAATQERLSKEASDLRRAQAQEIEHEVLSSTMSPEAAYQTIYDLRQAMQSGVAPEDLAVAELSAKNIANAEEANQADIALSQAIEDAEKYSTSRMLESLRGQLGEELASTIPGVEDAYEMITTWTLFPISGGTNVSAMMRDVFGI